MKVRELVNILEKLASFRWAEDWDNAGLVVGDPAQQVTGILVTLTVTEAAVEAARQSGANLIVSHHPPWLKLGPKLRLDAAAGRLAALLVRQEMAVIAAHTNLDCAPQGVNKCLADRLGLKKTLVLQPKGAARLYKLVVFVPRGHEDKVREAIGQAGAGHLGNYSFCTFQAPGTGTFLPQEGTDPYIGRVGELAWVEEVRLETIVPEVRLERVIAATLQVHPYEEVAYDVYPLRNRGEIYGLGRIGNLEKEMTLEQLVRRAKEALQAETVRFIGDGETRVCRVAVCGGAGGNFMGLAHSRGAQVMVTGDVDYHQALEAQALGLAVIDAGHEATERPVLESLAAVLQQECGNIPVHIFEPAVSCPLWREG